MKTRTVKAELWLPQPRELMFPFVADARHVERILAYRHSAWRSQFPTGAGL